MTPRYWLVLLCALLCSALCLTPGRAQEANGFCILQGTVKFSDGTPCKGMAVTIKVNDKALNPPVTTDDNGTFNRVAPAGEAVITTAGQSKTVTLVAGEQKSVAFEIKQTGVVVQLSYADKSAPSGANVNASVKAPGINGTTGLTAQLMAPGRFWLKDVPANATSLSVIVRLYQHGNGMDTVKRQIWNFDKVEELRTLAMTLDKPSQVFVLVLDATGAPMLDTPVKGTVNYSATNVPFWENEDAANRYVNTRRIPLNGKKTDGTGMVDLGQWPAQKYELSLRTDLLGGSAITFEPKADGSPLIVKYSINMQPRDVSQVVFDRNGKPAPNAEVSISYYWQGKVGLLQGKSDANGKVLWKALPPVRAIVWGSAVPPGVIPVDAVNVTTPLPAPTTDQNRSQYIRFNLTNLGDKPMRIAVSNRSRNNGNNSSEFSFNPSGDNPQQVLPVGETYVTSGGTLSFVAVTKSSPFRFACLTNFYVPYMEEGERGELILPLQMGTMLRGRFTTKTGTVTGLNQFRIVTVTMANDLTAGIDEETKRRLGLGYPQENADGTFTASLPGPGTYRLVVDLYDESTPPIPELLVDVPAAGKEIEVKLPDPLCMVLPGTELCWTTKCAPAEVRRLTAIARANVTPVFGPKEHLLAYWYHPSPDKLTVWNGTGQPQTLPLRAAFLNLQGVDGKPLYGNSIITLLPLLPSANYSGSSRFSRNNADPQPARASSESTPITASGETNYLPALWAGKYLLTSTNSDGMYSRYLPLDLAANGPTEVAARVDGTPIAKRPNPRYVRMKYAHGDLEQLRRGAADNITPIYDVPSVSAYRENISSWSLANGGGVNVPAGAKTVTLQWLGVGVMKNLPLPTAQETVLDLPTWSPGATVAGKIVSADGTPYAKKQIIFGSRLNEYSSTLRVTTDAQGGFSIKGSLPGVFFVTTENDNNGGWMLDVPENGLAGLTLRVSANPVRIYANNMNLGDNAQGWWYPDGGTPTRLPVRYNAIVLHDMALGSGWLWLTDGNSGDGRYQRFTLTPGEQSLAERGVAGPALGMSFPLDLTKGIPGAVTLIGQGERANVLVRYPSISWHPSTLLNRVVGQISAVPPGEYRVIVDTAFGPVETTAKITQYGTALELAFPAAPAAAPAAPVDPATAIGPAQAR